MEPFMNLYDKRIEQSVINISVKIADAVESVKKAKEMMANSEDVLIKAHIELEELYLILGNGATKESPPNAKLV